MKVSVIIPTLNEATNIDLLLRFLLQNSDDSLEEIIVVDAQSTDNTEGIAQLAGAITLRSTQKGRAIQMNQGAAIAKGDILYFVHADCVPPPSYLRDIKEAIMEGYDLGCYRYRFDSTSFILKINAFFTRFSPLWCRGGDETLFISKSFFNNLNGFDEYYVVMEEYDFIKRAKANPANFKIIPKYAIVSARKYLTNSWLQVQLANFRAFRMFKKGINPKIIAETYKRQLNYR